jgi:hypothetical protein
MLHAWITFGDFDNALLSVFEHVVSGEGSARPEKYGYQCQYGPEEFLFRYDFDPVQHPEMPYHKHVPPDPDNRRLKWDEVTLHDAMDEFWPLIEDRDEARRSDEEAASDEGQG